MLELRQMPIVCVHSISRASNGSKPHNLQPPLLQKYCSILTFCSRPPITNRARISIVAGPPENWTNQLKTAKKNPPKTVSPSCPFQCFSARQVLNSLCETGNIQKVRLVCMATLSMTGLAELVTGLLGERDACFVAEPCNTKHYHKSPLPGLFFPQKNMQADTHITVSVLTWLLEDLMRRGRPSWAATLLQVSSFCSLAHFSELKCKQAALLCHIDTHHIC